jgi:hypothetical protein
VIDRGSVVGWWGLVVKMVVRERGWIVVGGRTTFLSHIAALVEEGNARGPEIAGLRM